MKNKKILFGVIGVCVIVIIATISLLFIFNNKNRTKEETDGEKFSKEYNISKDNPFVYKDMKEIINILENGTGLVFLGFPTCEWCQAYVPYLNEVASDMAVTKIYYRNIHDDRQDKTEDYLKVVEILKDYLQYDQEGNKRIYVPSLIAVNKGQIVGFDDETAWDTKGYMSPKEYWENNSVEALKLKIEDMIANTDSNICTECN